MADHAQVGSYKSGMHELPANSGSATSAWPQRALILSEADVPGESDFDRSFADGLRAHGCDVILQSRNDPWGGGMDLALAYGPFKPNASMLTPARRLLRLPV